MEQNRESAFFCKGIEKTYGEGATAVCALRGVDLSLDLGKLLMIVGPSGSGKTTLISVIAGIMSQTKGTCCVLGKELEEMDDESLTRFRGKEIGFVFQSFQLIPMLTATENVSIPLLLNEIPRDEAMDRARDILCRFGLEDKLLVAILWMD